MKLQAVLQGVVVVASVGACASPRAQDATNPATGAAQAHSGGAASRAPASDGAANTAAGGGAMGCSAAGCGAMSGAAASGAVECNANKSAASRGSAGCGAVSTAAGSGSAGCGAAGSGAAANGTSVCSAMSGTTANAGAADSGAANAGAPGGVAAASGAAAASASHSSASGSAGAAAGAGAAGSAGQPSAAKGCNTSWLFCDDFETKTTPGMPPSSPWTIEKNGMGSVSVDAQTAAHSGKSSVKVSSDGGYQTFFALTGAPLFPHDGPLYLRLYIKLEAAMTSGHNTYYKAGASGSPSSEHETRMGVMNGMLMINQPAGDRGFLSNEEYYRDGNKPGVVFAAMKWECVETFFDPANKTIDVWVNGNEVKDLHRTDWEQDPIGALHFGFEKYAGPDAVIWYDDIAVNTQPIGCN